MTAHIGRPTTDPSHRHTHPHRKGGEKEFATMTDLAIRYIGVCLIWGIVLHSALEAAR